MDRGFVSDAASKRVWKVMGAGEVLARTSILHFLQWCFFSPFFHCNMTEGFPSTTTAPARLTEVL